MAPLQDGPADLIVANVAPTRSCSVQLPHGVTSRHVQKSKVVSRLWSKAFAPHFDKLCGTGFSIQEHNFCAAGDSIWNALSRYYSMAHLQRLVISADNVAEVVIPFEFMPSTQLFAKAWKQLHSSAIAKLNVNAYDLDFVSNTRAHVSFLCNLCTFDKDKDEAAAVDAEPEEDDFADIDDSAASLEEDLLFVMEHFDELDIEEEQEAYEKAGLPSDLRLHDIAGAKNDKLKKPGAAASAASASTAAPASHSCEDPAAHARFF